jgi:RHS repeat-associated protein
VITSITPPAAEVGGQLVINGVGFGSYINGFADQVSFNGVAVSAVPWSDTSITVTVPAGTTTGSLAVVENGVTSNAVGFTVTQPIGITSIYPTAGAVGTAVTIKGVGFGGTQSNSGVTFNGTAAAISTWSDTQITVAVPTGASTGAVTVEVADIIANGPSFQVTSSMLLTDSLGRQTTYESEIAGGKWYVSSSQGSGCTTCTLRGTVQSQFDTFGNVLSTSDELGHTTSYAYDSSDNLISETKPAVSGGVPQTTYTYNNLGEPVTVTDPLGHVTTNTYDVHGNLLTVTTPAPGAGATASVTHFAYNSIGELTQITDPLGDVTTLTYTSSGLVNTITDAQSNLTTYGYDARGNLTSVTDPSSHVTTYVYDLGNRLTTITYPDSSTKIFGYDYRGRRTSVTDQNGKTSRYVYDDADRLVSFTDSNANITNYAYDTESNLSSIQDANGNTTSYAYDAFGRLIEVTFPSASHEQYSYDAANNLTSKTDRNGNTILYIYDDLNRLTQRDYPDSTNVEYAYDLANELLQVADPTGAYTYTYDNMGRLVGSTARYSFLPSTTFSNSYTYDANSNRISMTDPQGGVTSYAYDTLNRLSSLAPPSAFGSGAFGFTYDGLSRRTQMTRPNGISTNYTYDTSSRLLSIRHQSGSVTIDGSVYTVDSVGNRLTNANQLSGVTSTYTFDPIYEVTQVTQSAEVESYSYDRVGNRTSSLTTASYTNNSSNELTATSSTNYIFDANGNTISKIDSNGTTTYSWDFENRLASVTLPNSGGVVTFKYDPFGQRVYKASSSAVNIYVYDRRNLIEKTDANGSLAVRYVNGLKIDEPLVRLAGSTISYYEADGQGSITSLSDASGSVANQYVYDSFGNSLTTSGAVTNELRFTGREFDSETNLYFYRARYYDPTAGRFISEDPINFSGGYNFYAYVRNNPVTLVDPTGLQASGGSYGTLPPNPAINTHVCDGNGGQKVQIAPGQDDGGCGELDCIQAHEQKHITDSMAAAPDICKGKPAGTIVGSSGQLHNNSEIAASNVEIECLQNKLKHACANCKQGLINRIKRMENYRDSFKNH